MVPARRFGLGLQPPVQPGVELLERAQLAVGKAPTTPARHAADTSSMPDTRSIGAAMTGTARRSRKGSRCLRHAGTLFE
jgi:hypothetical protein